MRCDVFIKTLNTNESGLPAIIHSGQVVFAEYFRAVTARDLEKTSVLFASTYGKVLEIRSGVPLPGNLLNH